MQEDSATNTVTNSGKDTPAVIEVTSSDLPIHCPMDNSQLWSSHPRVYIPVEAAGTAACSYCGTIYKLVD